MSKKTKIDRRWFLRGALGGAAVAIALPKMDFMLNDNGDAYADGTQFPKRFGLWFWGNGVYMAEWSPSGTGTTWTPSYQMKPLAPYKPYLNVLSNMSILNEDRVGHKAGHNYGVNAVLTGHRAKYYGTTLLPDGRRVDKHTMPTRSIDLRIAQAIQGDPEQGGALIPSIHVSMDRSNYLGEGTVNAYLSHRSSENAVEPHYEPSQLFDQLFAVGSRGPALDSGRLSVLDVAREQLNDIRSSPKLSRADKRRLDEHTEGIRGLETRIRFDKAVCEPPDRANYISGDELEDLHIDRNRMFSELIAYALKCDLTRVFTFHFNHSISNEKLVSSAHNEVRIRTHHNGITHEETAAPDPPPMCLMSGGALWTRLTKQSTFHIMEQLAETLRILKNTTEDDKNLLDQCAIIASTEIGDGKGHWWCSGNPMMIIGKAGGRLKGGIHHRFANPTSLSLATLTAARAVGLPLSSFGGPTPSDSGYTTSSIGAIET